MNRLIFPLILASMAFSTFDKAAAQDYSFQGGESIHRVSLVDPMGVGGVYIDVRAHFMKLAVDTSSSFDLRFNLSYGILPGLDFSYTMPYMRMVSGAYNKYGLGDGIFSLKYIKAGQENRVYKWGLQGTMMIPSGFREEIGGFPSYTLDQFGYGGRYLAKIEGKNMSLTGNLGGFWSEKGTVSEMFYGFGAKMKLMGRLLMLAGEVTSTQSTSGRYMDSYAYAGVESHLPYIGLSMNLGVEDEMKVDRPIRLIVGASFTFRKTVPGVSKGILETKKRYNKLMVFDFTEEKPGFTGYDVEKRLCRNLGSLEEVTIVTPPAEKAETASDNRTTAVKAAPPEKADLLVFARYDDFGYERNRGFFIPYIISLPKTQAFVTADLWVIDTKTSEQIYTGTITGKASRLQGLAFFQPNRGSENMFIDAVQSEMLRKAAVDDLIREMSVVFSDKFK